MKKTLIMIICLFCVNAAYAQSGSMQFEIDHLMDYIENSGCLFVRNGRDHSPAEAVQHINQKFAHFRNKIKTTEAFIEFCAAKSTMSNKLYEIKCPGQPILKSRDWLLKELHRIRERKAKE